MNPYLNHAEKVNMTRLMVYSYELEETIAEYQKAKNVDKDFLKWLRSASTYLNKAMERRYNLMEYDQAMEFSRNARTLRPMIVPSDRERAELKRLKNLQDTLVISMDDFETWYKCVIPQTCGKCQKKKYKECAQRKFLMRYSCDPVNPGAVGCCQYSYPAAGIEFRPMGWEDDAE
ncbi:DUF5651 domain-containing protein [Mitsuokella sp. AF21-1AC]|uniref:DUF5651 domain-containing protein n=1 Tax=Mitsuokella sp. AF21-1AC TaxID=2292235 RepID=UPI000E52F8B0|nr:DUF5651 domain-containing protein [Mitsuokella sp. AF21-1AC]RGS72025.1 hypothetical protein DWX75_07455 [Mitsuokella sp. AF21-1AC]